MLQSMIESMLLKTLVSSAYQATLEVSTAFDKSSANSRNSSVPSRDPCGTPDVITVLSKIAYI